MRTLPILMLLWGASLALAQEGFPLDGTWRGQRQAATDKPVTIVLVMQWDGHKISGQINPGPNSIPLGDAQLIPDGWRVSFTARSASGEPISFEGAIQDLGSYHRAIVGTWTEGARHYPVRIVRE